MSLELGGKNALVVCDDADLDNAVRWALASAFSNAGQRCAAASRIIVFDAVYDAFRDRSSAEAREYDAGPVISEEALGAARARPARERHATGRRGFWVGAGRSSRTSRPTPTLSCPELFGPVTILYRVPASTTRWRSSNDSPYGLTAASTRERPPGDAVRASACRRAWSSSTAGRTAASRTWVRRRQGVGHGLARAGVEALDVYSD